MEKTTLTNANIDWLKPYWAARTSYFDELIAKGIMKPTVQTGFVTSPEIQAKLDQYYSLPYGTGERTAFSKANPDLVAYWDAKATDTNNKRAELGLAPVESGYSGYGGYGKYTPKVKKVKLAKVKKGKAPKAFKVKAIKSPKIKTLSKSKFKVKKSKAPKIKVKIPKIPKFG